MCKNFHACLISHAGKYLHRLIAFANNNAQKYLRPKSLQYILNRTRKYNFSADSANFCCRIKTRISQVAQCRQNVSKWFEDVHYLYNNL